MVKPKQVRWSSLAMVVVLALAVSAGGQNTPTEPTLVRAGGAAGIQQYAPGEWGIIGFTVANPTDQPVEGLSTTFFATDSLLQFGRKVWVPARARLSSWHPVLPPDDIPADARSVEIKSLLLDEFETAKEDALGRRHHDGLLRIETTRPTTAVLMDNDDDASVDAVIAARLSSNLIKRMAYLRPDGLPPIVEAWAGVDQVVIAADSPVVGPAELLAMRRWLQGGGRLWVMLDQVDPAFVTMLLGDAFKCQVVDYVGLTEVVIESDRSSSEHREFERPIAQARVLASDVRVTHTVNGWPAAMFQQVGKGTVLYTTVGPRAWTRPLGKDEKQPEDPLLQAPMVATEPLASLASEFLKPAAEPVIEAEAFESFVRDQIGYKIVSRGPVVMVLGAFCIGLLIVGGFLAKREKLEHVGWTAPAMAVGGAVVLVVLGSIAQRAVPPTVAVGQFVEATPESADLRVTGLMGFYQSSESESGGARLGATRGGIFWPDMTGQGGTNRRMIWTDMDAWHWENVALPPGAVRNASYTYHASAPRPVVARVTFGPEGIAGVIDAPGFSGFSDGLIAGPTDRLLALRFDSLGAFAAGPGDTLIRGQFMNVSGVLSELQRRRRAVYERLLPRHVERSQGESESAFSSHSLTAEAPYPERPTVLVWADAADMGFVFPQRMQHTGSALMAIPIVLESAAPGTRVHVPSAFLPYTVSRRPGEGGVPIYIERGRQWIATNSATRVMLRFQLPRQVLPIQLDAAELHVNMSAPSRRLSLIGEINGEQVVLDSRENPQGFVRLVVPRPQELVVDATGGLILGIDVSDVLRAGGDQTLTPMWEVQQLSLEVSGTVQR